MKASELQHKTIQDLMEYIGELKEKLQERKMAAVAGNLKETSDIKNLKREIALAHTLINAKNKQ